MGEVKAKEENLGAKLKINEMSFDGSGTPVCRERRGNSVLDEFYSVCTRRKLKVNAWKSKVIVFEKES